MARIKNMGHSTVRFNEGVIVSGSIENDNTLIVSGSAIIVGALHISGSQLEGIRIGKGDNDYRQIVFENDNVNSANIHLSNAENLVIMNETAGKDIQFWVDSASGGDIQAITIKEDGKIGIQTNTPNYELDVVGDIQASGDLYVDKIRRATDSGTTTKILLNDEVIKLYAGHASDNICTVDATGLTIDNGSLETATIDYTDGDLSMTIADGGKVTFAAGFNVGSDAAGDILYHNGTSYIRLAKGTADQVLTMNDAATAPGWEAASGGGGGTNRTMFMGYVSLQQDARPVSYDYTNLGTGANNNYKGFLIVPFDGTLDTIIVSTKGDTVNDTNFGDITVTAYKNQNNFATGTAVVVNGDAFGQKASGTPKVYSGIFDFSLAVSQGDLIQIKVGRGAGGTTDSVVTIVFTES